MSFKFAARNLMRNKERTFLSLLMISGSIVALVLFRGFTDHSINAVEEVSTEMHYGHFQIAKKNYWQNTNLPRNETLLNNVSTLADQIKQLPEVKSVSGRLSAFGLISSGEKTENVSLMGYDLKLETGIMKTLKILEGKYFSNDQGKEIMVGHLLAHRLGIKVGDEITLVANSVKKVVNAGDFRVVGFFSTGTEEIDKYFAYFELSDLQNLMQTSGVDVLVVKLKNSADLSLVSPKLDQIINSTSLDIEKRDWISLAELFRKVKSFYDTQNLIIQSILISIVVLGILNTIGMSVLERIGEIGTLRSLGTTKKEIYNLFMIETLILVLAGIILGSSAAFLLGNFISAIGLVFDVPGASVPLPVRFSFSLSAFLSAGILIFIATIVASLIPISKGLRLNIVEALRKNI